MRHTNLYNEIEDGEIVKSMFAQGIALLLMAVAIIICAGCIGILLGFISAIIL